MLKIKSSSIPLGKLPAVDNNLVAKVLEACVSKSCLDTKDLEQVNRQFGSRSKIIALLAPKGGDNLSWGPCVWLVISPRILDPSLRYSWDLWPNRHQTSLTALWKTSLSIELGVLHG